MNSIEIVAEKEVLGRNFKVYGTVEEPLFLAKDVAKFIEHSNPRAMVQSVDEYEKVVRNVYTLGGFQECILLTEDGLYEVLMQSRKPIAKEFKKIVKEILKTLRKTGGYISNADKVIETYFPDMKDDEKAFMRNTLKKIEEQNKKIDVLDNKNKLLNKEILEWADRPLINALVRRYASVYENDYSKAWRDFKRELLYKYSVNINARITNYLNLSGKKTKPKTLDMIAEEEISDAICTAISLCDEHNIDISDLLQNKAS